MPPQPLVPARGPAERWGKARVLEAMLRCLRPLALLALAGLTLAAGACGDVLAPGGPPVEDSLRPPEKRVIQVVRVYLTACALTATGQLYCWGENRTGEFGDGTSASSAVPVLAAGGMRFARVTETLGTTQICGMQEDGTAYCWGYNWNGELGAGPDLPGIQPAPVPVAGDIKFAEIATSYHTCGLDLEGRTYCWGSGLGGQLGLGTATGDAGYPTPQLVAQAPRFAAITVGTQFTCGIEPAGQAWCWGWGAGLGDGLPADRSVYSPVRVAGGHRFSRIAAGGGHACALDFQGQPWCWGQFGSGGADLHTVPTRGPTGRPLNRIGTGTFACGTDEEGLAYCWALGGQPQAVRGQHRFVGLDASGSCGVTAGGSAYCWDWTYEKGEDGKYHQVIGAPEPIPALP